MKKKKRRRVYKIKRSGYRGRVTRNAQKRKIEVKVANGWIFDQAVMGFKNSSASSNLGTEYNISTDFIGGAIARSTAQDGRIGQHIFVKKIVFDVYAELCPKFIDSPNLTLSANTAHLRIIIDNQRATGALSQYFRKPVLYACFGTPDRRVVGVHFDKTYSYQAGFPANRIAGSPGYNDVGLGMVRKHRITFNVNRSVTFDANTDNTMKNDSDVYSFKILGYYPNMVAGTRYQTHCFSLNTKIYYTDD